MPAEQDTVKRLNVWADARERRNGPGGHGTTGTELLRRAAAELLAAQEQLAILNKHGGLAAEERDALQADLQAAQEREKALQERIEELERGS